MHSRASSACCSQFFFLLSLILPSAPQISVIVSANLNTPLMMGQTDKTLTCDVSGADNLNPTITYRWTRNGDPVTVPDSSSNTFSFSPLGLSQAGVYTCRVTVSSSLLNQNSNADAVNMQIVTIQGWLIINNSSVVYQIYVE